MDGDITGLSSGHSTVYWRKVVILSEDKSNYIVFKYIPNIKKTKYTDLKGNNYGSSSSCRYYRRGIMAAAAYAAGLALAAAVAIGVGTVNYLTLVHHR